MARVAIAAAMVRELKSTVRPAVFRTVTSAASIEPCWRTSSRNRDTIRRLKSTDRPSPRAITRLRAKTESGKTTMTRPMTPNVTAIANRAATSGTAAALKPRNTKNSNRIRNGSAKSSARPRSWEDTAAICTSATVGPPSQVLPLREGWDAMESWRAVTACFSCTDPTVATTTVRSPVLEIMVESPVLA